MLIGASYGDGIHEAVFAGDGFVIRTAILRTGADKGNACPLYTSYAADQEESVSSRGRRIIKKKKKKKKRENHISTKKIAITEIV